MGEVQIVVPLSIFPKHLTINDLQTYMVDLDRKSVSDESNRSLVAFIHRAAADLEDALSGGHNDFERAKKIRKVLGELRNVRYIDE